jgi:hypothetical protein
MKFICALWGHDADESAIAAHCRKLKITLPGTNEWVIAEKSSPFRDWIRWLKNQSFVADKISQIEDLPYEADPRRWLPGHENNIQIIQNSFCFDTDLWSDLEISEVTEGDYYTHPSLTDAARKTMGLIDLDPASCKEANRGVQATRFYGALQDGLTLPWQGRVWLNPPFGNWDVWAAKALFEWKSGNVSQMAVFMTANAATAKQVCKLTRLSDAVFISDGRYNCSGPKATAAAEGNLIFYFGNNFLKFNEEFCALGRVFFSPHHCLSSVVTAGQTGQGDTVGPDISQSRSVMREGQSAGCA